MTVSLNLSESEKVAKIERFGFDKPEIWKPGVLARCIDDDGYEGDLEVGTVYTVVDFRPDEFRVADDFLIVRDADAPVDVDAFAHRFEVVS